MKRNGLAMQSIRTIALILSSALANFGCTLNAISNQAKMMDNAVVIQGKVEITSSQRGQAYAVLYRQREDYAEAINKYPLTSTGKYRFNVVPGTYMLGAFIDVDQDGDYEEGEPATYLGMEQTSPTRIKATRTTITIQTLRIDGADVKKTNIELRSNFSLTNQNIGKQFSLDDDLFSRDNAALGFWRPFDYLDQFGGGLLMLQPFEPGKMPIIFVHGIFGTALDFKSVIASLDRTKYQPWVLQYPSGSRLDLVSDYFEHSLAQLQTQYRFPAVIVVAHSLGGLMTRSFVMKHQQNHSPLKLAMVMTVNSPLYGLNSAAAGVKHSPIVIPVWRDVATGSEYIERVQAWKWPKEIPYHLVFSFLPDQTGDGVVPLKSQLSLSLQDEAVQIHGFQAQHAAVLTDPEFIRRFNRILTDYQP